MIMLQSNKLVRSYHSMGHNSVRHRKQIILLHRYSASYITELQRNIGDQRVRESQ